jgi:hypothetical protein
MGGLDGRGHASRVCVEHFLVALGDQIFLTCREASQAERAHQAVHLQPVLAGELGDPPVSRSPVELELPEAVLALHETLREAQVGIGAGLDARHAAAVALDLHRRFEAFYVYRAARLRQRAAEQAVPETQRARPRGCKRAGYC